MSARVRWLPRHARNGIVAVLLAALAAVAHGAPQYECMIEPNKVARVGSPVPGVVSRVFVERGQAVKQGQPLAALESSVEKAIVESARVRAAIDTEIKSAATRATFGARKVTRLSDLRKERFASDFELDEATTERELAELSRQQAEQDKRLAELELDRSQKALEIRTIRSPFNGLVVDRHVVESERVEEQPLLTIAQVDPLNVEVRMPVALLGKIRAGMSGLVRPEAGSATDAVAKVTIVDRVVDAASGTFGVRLTLPNPRGQITAGVKCTVEIPGP